MGACNAKKTQKPQKTEAKNNINQNSKEQIQVFSETYAATPIGKCEATVISKLEIDKFYDFKKYLGSGGFGIVRLAQSKLISGKIVAIKSIKNDSLNSSFNSVKQELQILKQLDHPNIIKFFEIFQDSQYFHIVTEYCPNGDLLNYIYSNNLTETNVKQIINCLLLAVNHLHANNICHRDIKPQNILFNKNDEIKLIDFGLSVKMAENSQEYLQDKVGTLLYTAPEVMTGKYSKLCDVWSIGIILFILLSGEIPYEYETKQELFQLVKKGDVALSKCPWDEISEEAADFLRRLLVVLPQNRIDIQSALKHPWIKELNSVSKQISPQIIHNICNNFLVEERFKKEILKMIVTELSEEQIIKLRNAFKKFDINNRGLISFSELEIAIKSLGLDAPESQIREIMKRIHIENSNLTPKQQQIHYSEFIASTLDFQKIVTRERLYALFKDITGDKSTFTKEDLKQFMARKGRKLSAECIQEMMNEIDQKGIGEVGFEEFYEILLKTEKEEMEERKMPEGNSSRQTKKSVSKILAINKNLQKEDLF